MQKGVIKVWETIKKDPLIKTIVVILLGVLAFGFAFNIMFGAGSTSMENGSMMSAGYSLGNTLENIIGLLIKMVIIALLVGVIVWIFRAISKQSGTGQANHFTWMKEDPIIRNALIIIGMVIVLVFGFSFLRGFIPSGRGDEMMSSGTSYMASNTSYNFTSLLALLLKIVIFILILILGYGLVMYLKENYKLANTGTDTDAATSITKECPECKAKVKEEWKCCPYCGNDKGFEEPAN
jgi:hypothetical protein